MTHRFGCSLVCRFGLTFVALLLISGISFDAQSSALVPTGATWKYLDDGSNQGVGWRGPLFNDSAWPTGTAQLGYGDADEATVVSYGPNAAAKHITTYFRRTFPVSNPSRFAGASPCACCATTAQSSTSTDRKRFEPTCRRARSPDTTPASSAITSGGESTFVSTS